MNRPAIYAAIDDERAFQGEKWSAPHPWGQGDCSSSAVEPIVKVAVLMEEAGEVARAVLDGERPDALRRELTQVAAVTVAWLESL